MPQKGELRTSVITASCNKNCKLVGKLLVNLLHSLTVTSKLKLTLIVNLNLNGGPSKKAAQLSSLPVARRYGLVCLKSTLLITLLCPVISPTEEPLSHRNTAPNLVRKAHKTVIHKSYM